MTSLGRNFLLMIVWLTAIQQISDALWIQPKESLLFVDEGNRTGEKIVNITVGAAKDGDFLEYSLTNTKRCTDHIKLDPPDTVKCMNKICNFSIVAIKVLERDYNNECSVIHVSIVYGLKGTPPSTKGYSIALSDINDNAPQFENLPYQTSIDENFTVNQIIPGLKIKAEDQDDSLNALVVYTLSNTANIPEVMEINSNTGELTLKKSLDYETRNFYQYTVIATDKGNPPQSTSATVWIQINDVQDTPPVFTSAAFFAHVEEKTKIGSSVMAVSAEDGDRGNPNKIIYSLSDLSCQRFMINHDSGVISVEKKLDLSDASLKSPDGSCPITVKASELADSSSYTEQNITIFIDDINDHGPEFNSQQYTANVSETATKGNPITVNKNIQITDLDKKVENKQFRISLQKMDGSSFTALKVSPSGIVSQAFVVLLVEDPAQLDYEKQNFLQFQIVAKDVHGSYTSSAVVNLTIIHSNEYKPEFHKNYIVSIPEDTEKGYQVINVEATDQDRGNDGNITYRLYGSNGVFEIDPYTGNVTLCNKLDYEIINSYPLTVEASDGGNKKDIANLIINISDVNDNAPTFTPSKYKLTVAENEEIALTVKAVDDDKPSTKNSEVCYEIESVSPNLKNFTIDKNTGRIYAKSIDYEKLTQDQIIIKVMAYDQGIPQLNSTTDVTITIQDTNDNCPFFSEQIYDFSVAENATTGYIVGSVLASDTDRGEINKKLTYLLVNETDKFRINSQNGSILILGKLDRETCPQYTLLVKVVDGGTPKMSNTTIVTITVTDINDESPKLLLSDDIKIDEDCKTGSVVVKINATDEDLNKKLVYTIYKQQVLIDGKGMFVKEMYVDYFAINETTGDIYVNNTLDREKAETISLGIRVNDTNADGKAQYSQGQQRIILLDINDNSPVFLSSSMNLSLYENLHVNSSITRVSAEDIDENDAVTYEFEGAHSQFLINKTTGEITLVNDLDRETDPAIRLLVLAKDTKNPHHTSTATINLNILDYNDNSPIFANGFYNKTYNVPENATIGSKIVTVIAKDADIGLNADIRYSLVYKGSDEKLPISINKSTGMVCVSGELDREKTHLYNIEIEAKDMLGQYEDSRTGSTWIKINVTDVNDNDPVFTPSSLQTRSVSELASTNNRITQIVATDKDSGENSRLSFKLEGNESTLFQIDSTNGVISAKSSLVDQVGEKSFLVVATDYGSPPRHASANITINVTDVNNHSPVFSMQKVFNVSEDTCPGFNILNVTATDTDIYPSNNKVTYILKEENDDKYFNLDETTGVLKLKIKLNTESQAVYKLQITAKDNGKPTLSSDILLSINAINVDDEPPVFLKRSLPNSGISFYPGLKKSFSIPEGKEGRLVGKVNAYDSDPASKACYKIDGDTDFFEVRSIDGMGKIYTLKELDYEKRTEFHFGLKTQDCGNMVYNICGKTVQPIDDKLDITINVTDANDNPPRFINKFIHTAIQLDLNLGTPIVDLKQYIQDDDDYLENKMNFFHLFDFIRHGDFFMEKKPFSVKKGNIITNQLFSAVQMGHIEFKISVNDSIGQSDTAKMKIYIVGKANIVRITLLRSFEETLKIKDRYCRELSGVLGDNITIIAGKLESLKRKDGTYEKRKSVLLIYGLQFERVLPATELREKMDLMSLKLSDVQDRYFVSNVASKEPKVASLTSITSKSRVIFIVVIAVLIVSIIAIISLFYRSNQRYKRKLKAAQIDIHSNKQDFEKWMVPGSNVHALGQANPIYNKEISPVTALPDKVSLNSLDMNEVTDSAVFVDPYDEQEIALDFVEDQQYDTVIGSKNSSKNFLDNVIKEREAEMNKKNMSPTSMNGNVNSAFSTTNLETTEV